MILWTRHGYLILKVPFASHSPLNYFSICITPPNLPITPWGMVELLPFYRWRVPSWPFVIRDSRAVWLLSYPHPTISSAFLTCVEMATEDFIWDLRQYPKTDLKTIVVPLSLPTPGLVLLYASSHLMKKILAATIMVIFNLCLFCYKGIIFLHKDDHFILLETIISEV